MFARDGLQGIREDQPGPNGYRRHVVRTKIHRHVERHLVGTGLCSPISWPAVVRHGPVKGNVGDQAAASRDHQWRRMVGGHVI
ncbi:hypothetical protein D3C87_1768210 [compost metagenome]